MQSPQSMLKEAKTMALEEENFGWTWKQITYNPYKYKTFVTMNDEKPIHKSPCVFIGHECWALVPPK